MTLVWSDSDAYELTILGTYQGQDVVNRFALGLDTVGSANESVDTFFDEVEESFIPDIVGLSNPGVTYLKLRVRNLSNSGQGTFERTGAWAGANGAATNSNYQASALCVTFRLYTTRGIYRSGWKRFAGVRDEDISDGILVPVALGDLAEAIDAFKLRMLAGLSTTGSNHFYFGVWGKHATLPGYTLYELASVSDPFLGTQNSRKPKHGD